MGLKGALLSNYNLLFIFLNIIKFSKGNRQFTIKFLSSRLNIKLYNKLSKEVEDFED